MNYLIETYGCQMNTAESAAMEQALFERGWRQVPARKNAAREDAAYDLVILNTCAVRATAEQRILGRLAHYAALKKRRPFAILVSGCAAAHIGEKLKAGGADYILPASGQRHFAELIRRIERGADGGAGGMDGGAGGADGADGGADGMEGGAGGMDGAEVPAAKASAFFAKSHYQKGAFSAFVPVMSGCNTFCSYCIVPYVRGREIARPAREILAEIDLLAGKGVREITLLGQNVNAYRSEGMGFAELCRTLARHIQGGPVRWLRFLSSHPKDMEDGLIEALAENACFCRHIHLPVQHGSDRILGLMNRRYTRASYLALVAKLRAALSGLTLSTDILVGFPGETEADFSEILSLMEETRFNSAFMYHYNPREGTAAFALPGRIGEEEKRERLSRVIALQEKHGKAALEAVCGQERLVLAGQVSKRNRSERICHSEHNEMCVLDSARAKAGAFVRIRLGPLNGLTFKGIPLGKQD